MGIKILSFADFHVGVKTYGKIDPETGLNTREIQTLEILDEMVDYAINNKIPVIVAAGDMYKNNLPTPTLQDEFNRRMKRAADAGICCLILDGNHDVSKMQTTSSAMKQFSTLEVPNIIHTRFHKEYIFNDSEGNKIKFVFLPTYHTKEEIKSIVDKTTYDGYPIVFIGHMTVRGAALNDWLIEDKEIYIDMEDFYKDGVAAVICGHLHKHQILNQNPLIYYTGSTQRVDFNEEKQPKGFVLLDVNQDCSVENEFIEVQSQKFYTLKLDVQNNSNATEFIIDNLIKDEEKIKNSIVRIILDVNDATQINEKEIYQKINEFNAFNILDIQKVYDYRKHARNSEITEHLSIEKSLELYYQNKPRAKERIELGKEIIKQLDL